MVNLFKQFLCRHSRYCASHQEFLELTVETDAEQPLPPPKDVARKLRSQAIQAVQSWHASWGSAYKKLALGYHFLKQVKKVRGTQIFKYMKLHKLENL